MLNNYNNILKHELTHVASFCEEKRNKNIIWLRHFIKPQEHKKIKIKRSQSRGKEFKNNKHE